VPVRIIGQALFYTHIIKGQEVFYMLAAIVFAILYLPLGVIFSLTKKYR